MSARKPLREWYVGSYLHEGKVLRLTPSQGARRRWHPLAVRAELAAQEGVPPDDIEISQLLAGFFKGEPAPGMCNVCHMHTGRPVPAEATYAVTDAQPYLRVRIRVMSLCAAHAPWPEKPDYITLERLP